MTHKELLALADRIDNQAALLVQDNTYPGDGDPDLDLQPARHAAHLSAVSAGLRAMVGRAV